MEKYKKLINEVLERVKSENRMFKTYEIKDIFFDKAKDIEDSKKETLRLILSDESIKLDNSKVGGYPYFPKNMDYPKDSKNFSMPLLVQINFEEMPKLEDFPDKGILQIFLSVSDDSGLMGLDFDNPTKQKNFRVLYHENIEDAIEDFSFLDRDLDKIEKKEGELILPFDRGYEKRIEFKRDIESVNLFCQEFNEILCKDYYDFFEEMAEGSDMEMKIDILLDSIDSGSGHKISGYPYFTQQDPRSDLEFDVLLFQLDSEDDIMWGDMGIANFFIKRKDLIDKNFSNVLYNWDCS